MKSYDSIDYFGEHWGLPIFAFDKIDGSNLRFEWSKKRGFYKFGSRNMMIDENHEQFGLGVKIFKDKYEEPLSKIFTDNKKYRNILSFVCFGEYHGNNSSFGQHAEGDKMDVTLFDISQYKKGLIYPKEFIDDFGNTGIPDIIYAGNLTKELVEKVKKNEYNLSEGVVCKGKINTKKDKEQIYYCKIKTNDWFERLRALGNNELFEHELIQVNKFIKYSIRN